MPADSDIADVAEQAREREFWLQIRQGLLILLAAIEDRLGMKRSVPPRKERRKKQ